MKGQYSKLGQIALIVIVVMASIMIVCWVVDAAVIDPDPAEPLPIVFRQRERLMQAMDANPEVVVKVIEANITQARADAIIAALFPPMANPAEILEKLVRTRKLMLVEGFDQADATVMQLTERIDAIRGIIELGE